jgi:hypothetical protein
MSSISYDSGPDPKPAPHERFAPESRNLRANQTGCQTLFLPYNGEG